MNRISRAAAIAMALLLLSSLAPPNALGVGDVAVFPDRAHASVGETITWGVQLTGWTDPECAYFLYRDGELTDYRPRSDATFYQCTPDAPGTYSLKLFAGDNTGHFMYDGGSVLVDAGPARILSVAASRPDVEVGGRIAWTVTTEGGAGALQYGGKVYRDGVGIDKIESEDGGNVLTYAPIAPGTYTLMAVVRDGDALLMADEAEAPVVVSKAASAPLSITSVAPDRPEARVGEPVTWTATAEGGSWDVSFVFYLVKDGLTIDEAHLGSCCVYRAVPKEEGAYCVVACAACGDETANLVSAEVVVRAQEGVGIESISCPRTIAVLGRDAIPWAVTVKNAVGDVRYTYTIYRNGAFLCLGWDEKNPSIDFIATETGEYRLEVIAQDDVRSVSGMSGSVNVVDSNLAVDSVEPGQLMGRAGVPVSWKVRVSGAGGDLHFAYAVYRGGQPVKTAHDSAADSFTFTPDKGGSEPYTLLVQVTDGIRMVTSESAPLPVVASGAPRILSVKPSALSCAPGTPVTWTVELENGPDPGGIAYALTGAASGAVAGSAFADSTTFSCTLAAEDTYSLRATLASDPTGVGVCGTPVRVETDSAAQLLDAPIGGLLPAILEAPLSTAAPDPGALTPVLPGASFEAVTPRPTATKRPVRVQKTPAPTATPSPFFKPPVLTAP